MNLALKWGQRKFTIRTDSVSVFKWLKSVIDKDHNVRTGALAEVLISRRLNILSQIIDEEGLSVEVEWVHSNQNKADSLTRVPSGWLRQRNDANGVVKDLRRVHELSHFGVDRTHELAEECYGKDKVSKKEVRKIIRDCEICARVDPPRTFNWDRGPIPSNST